jgi:uncharacterized membrane protein YcaP (DUF421 family)
VIEGIVVISLKTLVILVLMFVVFRVLGKRAVGQLNVYDLVTLMALANAVQNAMTSGKGDLWVGLSASLTLIGASWLLGRIFVGRPKLEDRIIGVPTVLVDQGHIKWKSMHHECITKAELVESIRLQGLDHLSQVRLAVLEVDGNISVVPFSNKG